MTCTCGKPSDGWPDGNGGELCQECWESVCDKSWWEAVLAISRDDDLPAEYDDHDPAWDGNLASIRNADVGGGDRG
jgi:hypothetical protein